MSVDGAPRQSDAHWDDAPQQPLVAPQSVEAERSVLGAMLLSSVAAADALESLRGPDFYRPGHELIFDAAAALYSQGAPVDAVTVTHALQGHGDLGRVGGPAYIHALIADVPTAANVGFYARIVSEKAALRRLVEACQRGIQLAQNADDDVAAVIDQAQAEMYAATESRSGGVDYVRAGETMQAAVDEIEAASNRGDGLTGVPTGFLDLDALTGGLHPGQMVTIGARPAQGKTTLGLDILRSAAIHHGMASVMFSLEMGRTEIAMRLLSAEGRIPLQNMRKGMMREEDWTRLAKAVGEIEAAPLFIDDSPNMSMMQIRAKCRRLKQRHDLKLVVIDYLQLMSSGKRVESRQQEVSEFSRAIKLLAKELQLPVIALSQLNRGPEQRADKKPAISDLRESGSVEQDSDMVILLHREDAYQKEHPRAGEADFIVAKHRNGPTDTITVAFQGHYSRFVDMAQG